MRAIVEAGGDEPAGDDDEAATDAPEVEDFGEDEVDEVPSKAPEAERPDDAAW
jgi:hypothetical protein